VLDCVHSNMANEKTLLLKVDALSWDIPVTNVLDRVYSDMAGSRNPITDYVSDDPEIKSSRNIVIRNSRKYVINWY
jgi:hypothetical protein